MEDLELIRSYEPNVVKAAWNIFGKSYEYRQRYNAYKDARMRKEKEDNANVDGQMNIFEYIKEREAIG